MKNDDLKNLPIQKKLNIHEIEVLSCITQLNLNSTIIPYRISGNIMYMAEGVHPSRENLDIVKLYNECLSKFYSRTSKIPFAGIYAFYGDSGVKYTGSQSFFIKKQIDALLEYKQIAPELALICESCRRMFNESIVAAKAKGMDTLHSVLLHGDLHLGNILLYNGEYKLIDFEYLRYGLKEIELCFVLCWDFIVNENLGRYSSQIISENLSELVCSGCIEKDSAFMIQEVFIPMFVLLACIYSSGNIYRDSSEIRKAIAVFYDNYYVV